MKGIVDITKVNELLRLLYSATNEKRFTGNETVAANEPIYYDGN